MHNLETEFLELHREGQIDEAAAAQAIALERGTLFSVSTELRITLYSAVAAISGGLGLLLKKNLDRIGPVAVAIGLAAIAAACYTLAARLRRRAAGLSMGADYVLLLGALIVSADVGYAESQFHWLGASWSWDFLILAAVHAAVAYAFESALVLSLSLASLAAWFGAGLAARDLFSVPAVSGLSALGCAAVVLGWREIHRGAHGSLKLQDVFGHFAVNLAFWGAIILCARRETRSAGAAIALLLGAITIALGLRSLREAFAVYGVIYPAIGICIVIGASLSAGASTVVSALLLTVIGAAALLMYLHAWIKERR